MIERKCLPDIAEVDWIGEAGGRFEVNEMSFSVVGIRTGLLVQICDGLFLEKNTKIPIDLRIILVTSLTVLRAMYVHFQMFFMCCIRTVSTVSTKALYS